MKKCINIIQIFGCENYKIRKMFHLVFIKYCTNKYHIMFIKFKNKKEKFVQY